MLKRMVNSIMHNSRFHQIYIKRNQSLAFRLCEYKPNYFFWQNNKTKHEMKKIPYHEQIADLERLQIDFITDPKLLLKQTTIIQLSLEEAKIKSDEFVMKKLYTWILNYVETCYLYYAFQHHTELINFQLLEDITSEDSIKNWENCIKDFGESFNQCFISKRQFEYACRNVKIMKQGKDIDLETLHSWMNDQFDCLALIEEEAKQDNLDEILQYTMKAHITFNFLISQILLQRGDKEEFLRFLKNSFENLEQFIIHSRESNDLDLQNNIIETYLQILIIHGSSMMVDPQYDENSVRLYYNLFFSATQQFDNSELSYLLYPERLTFCQFLISNSDVDEALTILEQLQNDRRFMENNNYHFMFLIIYHSAILKTDDRIIEAFDLEQQIDEIETSSLDRYDCKAYGIKYHNQMFLKELKENKFERLQMRLNAIVECQIVLLKNNPNQQESSLMIFSLIDEIVKKPNLPERNQHLSQIYHLFKSIQDYSFCNQLSEFHKHFYFVSLSFMVMEYEKLNVKECFEQLDKFVILHVNQIECYQTLDQFQEVFLIRLLSINYFLLDNTQYFSKVKQQINRIFQIIDNASNPDLKKDQFRQLFSIQQKQLEKKENNIKS